MNGMLLSLTGRAGSGKDTVADILVRNHGFVKIALADPLKRICKEVFDFSAAQLWGPSEARNAPDRRYPRTLKAKEFNERMRGMIDEVWRRAVAKEFGDEFAVHFLTVRHAAQQLGTEWGRRCYENVWVHVAIRTAHDLLTTQCRYEPSEGLIREPGPVQKRARPLGGVVISDARFHNEVSAIHAAGGIVWKCQHGAGLEGTAALHESERHIDSLEVDALVPRGPLSEVPAVVAKMLADTPVMVTY